MWLNRFSEWNQVLTEFDSLLLSYLGTNGDITVNWNYPDNIDTQGIVIAYQKTIRWLVATHKWRQELSQLVFGFKQYKCIFAPDFA